MIFINTFPCDVNDSAEPSDNLKIEYVSSPAHDGLH